VIFVFRDGALVPKGSDRARCPQTDTRSDFPAPRLSRIEPFESPITGREISSWRERDRDMEAAGAVDPRDLKKEAKNATRRNDTPFEWGRLPDDPG
jgi:hypothetical protein